MKRHAALLLIALTTTLAGGPARGQVVFEDGFGSGSRGERARNTVVDPPPAGMGYRTDAPEGFSLRRWVVADAEADGPRRSFWCIPRRADGRVETYAQQAGRSHHSIAFAATPVPPDALRYEVELRQWASDNDYIGFVLGASAPRVEHDGVEIGYERQIPGTDRTVPDIYYRGALGTGLVTGAAAMRRWARHVFEVHGQHVRWSQDGEVLLAGALATLRRGGHFGIVHRYERGTRYDDVRIRVIERGAGPTASGPGHVATVSGGIFGAIASRPALPRGMRAAALLAGPAAPVPELRWWGPPLREGPARLRLALAAPPSGPVAIEAFLLRCGRRLGRVVIDVAAGELALDAAQARSAVEEGVGLVLAEGSGPAWILTGHEGATAAERELLPQLVPRRSAPRDRPSVEVDDPPLDRGRGGGGPVPHPELREDVVHVLLHRSLGQG